MENLSFLSSTEWLTILSNIKPPINTILHPPTNIQIISSFTYQKKKFNLDLEDPFHFEAPESDYFRFPDKTLAVYVARQKVFCCNYKTIDIAVEEYLSPPCDNENLFATNIRKTNKTFKAILKLSQSGKYMSHPFTTTKINSGQTNQLLNCKQCGNQKTKVIRCFDSFHFAERKCSFCYRKFYVCTECTDTSFYAKSKLNDLQVKNKMICYQHICHECDLKDISVQFVRNMTFTSKSIAFLRKFANLSKRKFKVMQKRSLSEQLSPYDIDHFSHLVDQSCTIANKTFFYIIVNLIENLQTCASDEEGQELMDDFYEELQVNSDFLEVGHLKRLLHWFEHLTTCYSHRKLLHYKINGKERLVILESYRKYKQLEQFFKDNLRVAILKKN